MNKFVKENGLSDIVEFTGRIPDSDVIRILSSCDICVQPDPLNPLNNSSTMNKAMEYMALKKPVVAFDLVETRYSCGDAALYAKPNEIGDLADKIVLLADNKRQREEMGELGLNRVKDKLEWRFSEPNLLNAYEYAFQDEKSV